MQHPDSLCLKFLRARKWNPTAVSPSSHVPHCKTVPHAVYSPGSSNVCRCVDFAESQILKLPSHSFITSPISLHEMAHRIWRRRYLPKRRRGLATWRRFPPPDDKRESLPARIRQARSSSLLRTRKDAQNKRTESEGPRGLCSLSGELCMVFTGSDGPHSRTMSSSL